MTKIINKKHRIMEEVNAVMIVEIFLLLDEVNPNYDTKEVWNNLKGKEFNELVRAKLEIEATIKGKKRLKNSR